MSGAGKKSQGKVSFSTLGKNDKLKMISAANGKLAEATFFLGKLSELDGATQSGDTERRFGWYLSAFLTAARSAVQALCPEREILNAWDWYNKEIMTWSPQDAQLHMDLTECRNISVHRKPVNVGKQAQFVPLSQVQHRPRTRGLGIQPIFVTGMPGSNRPAVGVVSFHLDVNGRAWPALAACRDYLRLVERLVGEREKTKDSWR